MTMTKKLRLQRRPDYNYFENLPDELVIIIFTKLSSSNDDEEFLDDIKSLGRCSAVSKRFDALTCLVPTLSLRYPDINTLYECCPKILKKFKHIRSLQVTHWSSTEICMWVEQKPLPFIFWEAAYTPHSYRLSFVSYEKLSHYIDDPQKQQSLMLSDDDGFFELSRDHNSNMIYLHHMLVSSIKAHIYLQRVVVSDFNHRGTLTLEDDMLVELRNCTSPKYQNEKGFWVHDRSGSIINLDVPSLKPRSGVVINNFYFSIFEWDTESHEEDDDDDDDDGDSGLPHLKCHEGVNLSKVLTSVMEDADDVKVNDDELTLKILSHIHSEGYL